ncbi:MAG TPA: SprT family zinc-dependent metalloprotease [Candidatus Saccharimonadales bacterium]|nr:SprT family zinc-dependent metalloprotease [Candidatus Saccharimonadales bacterium]
MAVKNIDLPSIGSVRLYKRRGAKSIRLSVTSTGDVRVTLPYWLPYEAGIRFARSKQSWIASQLEQHHAAELINGQPIGKSHHLQLVRSHMASKVSSRVDGTSIRITYPLAYGPNHDTVQKAAITASIRALRSQAENLLPQRLRFLSNKLGLPYQSSNVKQMKGRWGSCDANKNITLNLFLMQLPWHLIDYVLMHELIHTKVLHHGSDFWREFERHYPEAKKLRREIREYRPVVEGGISEALRSAS